MIPDFAKFIFMLCAGTAFIAAAWVMTYRLTPETKRARIARWLLEWSLKGLALPLGIWALMNIGLSWNLQPFMPQVAAAQNSGTGWFAEFVYVGALGLFIAGSYWSAATLGWVLLTAAKVTHDAPRKDFKALCWTCLLGLGLPALCILILGGWPLAGLAVLTVLAPVAGYAPAIIYPKQLPPMYARAIARLKFGKYNEAEMEIIRELEKSEDDVEGWLMLAELYATQYHDLEEAERTVLEICDQPRVTPVQLSQALHRLADWHLKLGGNPDGARRALQMLCDRLRGSHLAHMAELRLNQVPKTADDLREQQAVRSIPLPALGAQMDAAALPHELPDQAQAAKAANACVERLKQDPNNVLVREKLARIFTEQLNRADLGIEQLRLLLELPEQPESRRAEWLGLTGAWHITHGQDPATGRKWLERLLTEFPSSPQAFAARRRLEQMAGEEKQRAAPRPPPIRIELTKRQTP